jgi:hypothetical protein
MSITYRPINTTTLTTSTTTVTFSSIPSTYTDLILVAAITAGNTGDGYLRFNSDTGNNYSDTVIRGNGSAASSVRDTSVPGIDIGPTSVITGSEVGIVKIQIQNYSNSTTYKTSLIRFDEGTNFVNAIVGLWRNTNAITSIDIVSRSGTWGVSSTFTLYGIKAE